MEMVRRHAGDARNLFETELFVIGVLNVNVGALNAAIELGASSGTNTVNGIDLTTGGAVDEHHTFGNGAELVGNAVKAISAQASTAQGAKLGADFKCCLVLNAFREADHDAVTIHV